VKLLISKAANYLDSCINMSIQHSASLSRASKSKMKDLEDQRSTRQQSDAHFDARNWLRGTIQSFVTARSCKFLFCFSPF
jgi:hypothetical protein